MHAPSIVLIYKTPVLAVTIKKLYNKKETA